MNGKNKPTQQSGKQTQTVIPIIINHVYVSSFFVLTCILNLRSSPTVPSTQALNFRAFSLLLSLLTLTTMSITESLSPCGSDTNPVIPTSTPLVTFLERVQQTALKTFGEETDFDPKLYVDLSLKLDLSTTEEAFDELQKSANGSLLAEDLKGFIGKYFEGAGNDMVYVEPVDFVSEPEGFLPKVENKEVRAWALEVHALWKNLSRRVSDRVQERPELHTLLPLPEPAMIPGSRFREVYYWDSYWVIRLVLLSFFLFC